MLQVGRRQGETDLVKGIITSRMVYRKLKVCLSNFISGLTRPADL